MAHRTSRSPWVKGIRFALGRSAVHGCHPRRRAQCARRWHRGRDRCHKFTATQQVHLDWLRSRIVLGAPPSLVVATGAGLTLIRVAVKAATPRTAKVRRVTYYGHAGDAHKATAFRPSRPLAVGRSSDRPTLESSESVPHPPSCEAALCGHGIGATRCQPPTSYTDRRSGHRSNE